MNDFMITHYYSPKTRALHSITAASEQERKRVADYLSTLDGIGFNRYRKFDFYLKLRVRTEKWLYEEFLKSGGQPKTRTPVYFTLGASEYMGTWFGHDTLCIRYHLDDIDEAEISFTLKDSMLAYISSRNEQRPQRHLFTKSMLLEYLQPCVSESINAYCGRQNYIEAQVWNPDYFINTGRYYTEFAQSTSGYTEDDL